MNSSEICNGTFDFISDPTGYQGIDLSISKY